MVGPEHGSSLTQSEYDAAKARLLAGPASNPWLAVNRVRRAEDDKTGGDHEHDL